MITKTTDISALLASDIAKLTTQEISNLTRTQQENLTAEQVSGLTDKMLAVLPTKYIPADTFAGISINAIPSLAIKSLTAEQFAALTFDQIHALTAIQVNTISKAQFLPMDTGNFAAFSLKGLSGLNVKILPVEQVEYLTSDQIASLTGTQFSQLSSAQIKVLTSDQVSALTPQQALMLKSFANISDDVLTQLTPAFISAIPAATFSTLTVTQLPNLLPEQLAAINDKHLATLNSTKIAALGSEEIAALSINALKGLTKSNIGGVSLSNLTNEQFTALSPQQIGFLSTTQISQINTENAVWLTPSIIKSLTPNQVSALSVDAIKAIEPDSLAALTSKNIIGLITNQIGALTVDQVGALSSSAVKALSSVQINSLSIDDILALPPIVIKSISTTAFPSINSLAFSQLSAEQVAALSVAQIDVMTTKQISQFGQEQAGALLANQVLKLSSNEINKLSNEAITNLNPSVIKNINISGFDSTQIGMLTPEHVTNLQANQVASLTSSNILGLHSDQIENLKPYSFKSIANNVLPFLSTSALQGIQSSQLNTLSTTQLELLSPAQVGHLPSDIITSYLPSKGYSSIVNNDTGAGGIEASHFVFGSSFADTITAGVGNDTVTGGGGADYLIGGKGRDVYTYTLASDSNLSNTNSGSVDRIVGEFNGSDADTINFGAIVGALQILPAQNFGIASTAFTITRLNNLLNSTDGTAQSIFTNGNASVAILPTTDNKTFFAIDKDSSGTFTADDLLIDVTESSLTSVTIATFGSLASLVAPNVNLVNDSGLSSTDKITNDATLSVGYSIFTLKYSLDSTNGKDGTWQTAGYEVSQTPKGVQRIMYCDGAQEGGNTVYVKQVDNSGNESAATRFDFTIDWTPPAIPTVTITNSIRGYYTQDGLLTVSGLSDTSKIQYRNTVNGVPSSYSSTLPTLVQGQNQIEILGEMDIAGNQNHGYLDLFYDPTLYVPTSVKAPWTLITRNNWALTASDGTTLGSKFYLSYLGSGSDMTLAVDPTNTKVFFLSYDNSNGGVAYTLNSFINETQGIIQLKNGIDYYNNWGGSSQLFSNTLNLNNKIGFLNNNQLIISDGATTGTNTFSNLILPNSFRGMIEDNINNRYWFVANSVPYGSELGLLTINPDGTATSKIVKDINPSGASSLDQYSWYYNYPANTRIVLSSGKLLFSATDKYTYNYTYGLFVSDGTEEGTIRIGDDLTYTSPSNFTNLSNKIIFISSGNLTVSDGTDLGTNFLTSHDGIGTVTSITKVDNNTAYFSAHLANNTSLYSTDGSTFSKICDLTGNYQLLSVTPNKVYLSISDLITGKELWVADKADSSFYIVKDILAGTGSALEQTSSILTVGDKIIFPAYIDANTKSLFISDGTEPGTIKISNDMPLNQFLLNNTLIFSNSTGVHSVDTSAQVPTVLNLNTTAINVEFQQDLDQVFFKTSNGDLFSTTGQTAAKLAENVVQFKVLEENSIYFIEHAPNDSLATMSSLWYSDGTVNGTHFVSYDVVNINLDNAVVIHTVGYPQ